MKQFKRLFFSLIVIVLGAVFVINPMQVFASDNSYTNEGATYKVTKTVDEYELGYGVYYHRDLATTSVSNSSYARGDAYGNEQKYSVVAGTEYTQQVNVLEIDMTQDVQLIPYAFLDGNTWIGSTVKKAAAQYELKNPGYRVVAAVNGDYFQISHSMPASTGVTIGQGEYYKAVSNHSAVNTIAIKNDGEGKQLFTTKLNSSTPTLSIYDNDGNVISKVIINKVNAEPSDGEIAVYYANKVQNFEPAIVDGTPTSNIWLVDNAEYSVTTQKNSFYGVGYITKFVDEEMTMSSSQFAIKCNNEEVSKLLATDVKIRVQYEYTDESVQGIENFIGFPFTILENGVVNNQDAYRHPRTIIGQKENGEVVLAVIDGRQEKSKGFYGASSMEMAALMAYYGCVDAWNLDGGGSSTLIVRKQDGWVFGNTDNGFNTTDSQWYVTNSPSDGGERSDGNHLFVVVKVPDVKIELDELGEDFITLNVALLTDINKYNDLYVFVNKVAYQVIDGQVTITGLKKDTKYTVNVFAKVDDEYLNLMASESYSTNKPAPSSISVAISLYEKNGVEHILIRYKVDKADAVRKIRLLSGEETYMSVATTIMIEKSQDFYDNLTNAKIEIVYQLNDLLEEESIILDDYTLSIELMYGIDEMLYTTNSSMKSIFE